MRFLFGIIFTRCHSVRLYDILRLKDIKLTFLHQVYHDLSFWRTRVGGHMKNTFL